MRMIGRLLVLLAALIGVALLALWPWSHRHGYIVRPILTGADQLSAANGELVYWHSQGLTPSPHWENFDAGRDPLTAAWVEGELSGAAGARFVFDWGGFAFGRIDNGGSNVVAACPIWTVALLSAMPAIWWVARRRRRGGGGFEVGERFSPVATAASKNTSHISLG